MDGHQEDVNTQLFRRQAGPVHYEHLSEAWRYSKAQSTSASWHASQLIEAIIGLQS